MGESSGARVKEILFEALELPAAQREAFVAARCGSDDQLRQGVLALLRATPTGEASPLDLTRGRLIAAAGAATGLSPGSAPNYELLEPIGEGGFGVVYLARQLEPVQRQVAFKVIKPGMDSKAVLRRFEAERQALAVMDHPHVAKVFDAGVTDRGLPFFAMEHVRGKPITAFCDEHRLSLQERLAVFVQVCEAVQHAHTKAIIHRDIKPSNILVSLDAEGHPAAKVIDFGVAKALDQSATAQTLFTEHGQMVGTPEYMSPEQAGASGQDIDTRTDVYSLGVVLYELLTGLLPFDPQTLREAGFGEIQRIIRESDPPRPSTRLSTVGDAAAELTRSRRTDLKSLTSLLRGELDWVVMKCLGKDRSRRYETASALATDIARYLANEPVVARPPTSAYRLRKFLRRNQAAVLAASVLVCVLVAATGISLTFAIDADRARRAEAQRAKDLQAVADFQADQLGAIDPEVMGIGLRRSLIEAAPADMQPQLTEALSSINFTDIALLVLQTNIFERTIQAIDTQFADQPLVQAQLLQSVSSTQFELGLLNAALDPQRRALAIRKRILGDYHIDTLLSINDTGFLLQAIGQLEEAETYYRQALEGNRHLLGSLHQFTLTSLNNVGGILDAQGRFLEAEPYYREAVEGSRRILGADDPETLASLTGLGFVLLSQGRLNEAEPLFQESLEGSRRALGNSHPETLISVNNMGFLLSRQDRHTDAQPYFFEAMMISRRVNGDQHPDTLYYIHNVAKNLHALGRLDEAEPFCREAFSGRQATLGDSHPNTMVSLVSLGSLLLDQGRFQEVLELLGPAEAAARAVFTDGNSEKLASFLTVLGRGRVGFGDGGGRFVVAEEDLLEAHEIFGELHGLMHKDTLACTSALAHLYDTWNAAEPGAGYDAKAAEWRAKLSPPPSSDDHKASN